MTPNQRYMIVELLDESLLVHQVQVEKIATLKKEVQELKESRDRGIANHPIYLALKRANDCANKEIQHLQAKVTRLHKAMDTAYTTLEDELI